MAFCEECQMSQYTHYLEPVASLLGPTLESPPELRINTILGVSTRGIQQDIHHDIA